MAKLENLRRLLILSLSQAYQELGIPALRFIQNSRCTDEARKSDKMTLSAAILLIVNYNEFWVLWKKIP